MIKGHNRRAATLVEIAATITALVLIVCLVLPVTAQNRTGSRSTRSRANLHLHGQVLALYAGENRNEVLNPYPGPGETDQFGNSLFWTITPSWGGGSSWLFFNDSYSYHWGPMIRQYYPDYQLIDVFAAPGDQETYESIDQLSGVNNWVTDISYWYSPTMFYNANRFRNETGGDTLTGAVAESVTRNRFEDMTFPSHKVVLLEKQDFAVPDKILFSHPDAHVGILFGDSSVGVSDNQPLYDAVNNDPDIMPSGGNWADPEGLALYHMDNQSSPDELLEDQQNLYPAFYMWTRRGIQGRDLF